MHEMLRSREEMEEQDAQREHLVVRVCTYRNVTVYMIGVLSEMNEELSEKQKEHIENIEILKVFDMMYELEDEAREKKYIDRLKKIFNGVDSGVRKVKVAELWANYVINRSREERMEAGDAMKALDELLAASTESPPRKRQRVEYSFV